MSEEGTGSESVDSETLPKKYSGVRNQTLAQLIYLKERLVVEFISEQNDVDYSKWWMTVGQESPNEPPDKRNFREYLHEDVSAGDVKKLLEAYKGCEGMRKAYDYLNTLRAIESKEHGE